MLYGKPIEGAKKPADEITHDDLRSLTDRVSVAIQKMSGQEFVNEYAQKVKAELTAQQAAEEAERYVLAPLSEGSQLITLTRW